MVANGGTILSSASNDFNSRFEQYRQDIESAGNERERAQYFIEFLRNLPELDDNIGDKIGYPTDIRPELEEYLSGQRRQQNRRLSEFGGGSTSPEEEEAETVFVDVSGRLDARVGNLVIEFKDDLEVNLDDAKEQLRTYVYLLYEEGIEEDFLCLATDGEIFITYETLLSESIETETDIRLSELTRIHTETADIEQVKRWVEALFSERVHPVVEQLDTVFGVQSDTFDRCLNILREAYEESEAANVHRDEWADYLAYAQGESPENGLELYLQHTYLASFAKLLSYMVFTRGSMPSIEDAKDVLSGEISAPFPENLFDQDLFSWIGRTDAGDDFVEIMVDKLLQFNLGRVDQDVFKKLYQDMVSYEVRHDLGEYYTPDWLAEYIIYEKLDLDPSDSVLDPGCGSGTFLVEAIQYKRERSGQPVDELVTTIPDEVVGIDVHPLAVGVAKANYVAAIRDLLPYRRDEVQIPVFLADSVLFDEELAETDELEGTDLEGTTVRGPIEISEEEYYIPQAAINQPEKLDQALGLIQEYIDDGEGFEWRLAQDIPEFDSLTTAFERIRENIARAAREGRDSIHAFILKNFFRPLYLGDNGSFDALIGNPPWLSYNYMSSRQQDQVRDLMNQYGLYPGAENVSNMELATLFVFRCMDLYLDDDGKLGYVMPRAIFSANQHDSFRRGEATTPFNIDLVLDLENIEPLFNVPTAAVIGRKDVDLEYPFAKETIVGELSAKNLGLAEAIDELNIETGEIFFHGNGVTSWDEIPEMQQSPYYSSVYEGAHLTPRPLWFCQLQNEALEFGFDADRPPLINSDYAVSRTKRDEYTDRITAEVEKKFIYSTLIGSDLVPFTHQPFRRVVLPIVQDATQYTVIKSDQARSGGFRGLASWLEQAEEMWSLTDTRIDNIYDQVNHRNKIVRQKSDARYRVLTPSNGTNVVSSVVDLEDSADESPLPLMGYIADQKTKYYETDDKNEAYYLMAVLNSNIINDSIKNLQSRGDFGPRDIHKLPYEFPVPLYDEENDTHHRLAELGETAEEKAEESLIEALDEYSHIGYIRRWVKEDVEDEIEEIDEIVEQMLQRDD